VIPSPTDADRAALRDFLRTRVSSVAANAGRAVAPSELAHALVDAFRDVLDLRCEPGELTDAERRAAAELVETKYGNPGWTFRR
jgi:lipoate-protein ligase A